MNLKKGLILAIITSMLLGVATTSNAAFGRSYTAPKGTVTIDAKVDDVWKTARWTNVDKPWDGTRDTNSELRIKLVWDENYLYFLAEVYDEHKNKRQDLVELYLDQKNDKQKDDYGSDDTQTRFYVHQVGVVKGDATVSGKNAQFDAPSAIGTLGTNMYIVEGAIKWPEGTPSVGAKMGLEFMYNDGSLYSPWADSYRWNADTANGDEPPYAGCSAWGTLILAGAGTALPDNTYVDNEKMTSVFKGEGPSNNKGNSNTSNKNDKDTSNKDTANKDTNKDTANKDTANKDTANKDTTDKDTTNKDTSNKDTSNKDTSNKNNADKNVNANANNVSNDEEAKGPNIKTIIILAALAIIIIAIVVILLTGKKKEEPTAK